MPEWLIDLVELALLNFDLLVAGKVFAERTLKKLLVPLGTRITSTCQWILQLRISSSIYRAAIDA